MSSTNYKSVKKAICKRDCCTENPKSFLFLMKSDSIEGTIVKLRHPQKNAPSFFLLSHSNKVYEVFTYNDPCRSFFLNDNIHSNGKMYITSTIDPLFLVIPYLQSSSYCTPLDHLLKDDEYSDIEKLIDYLPHHRLDMISDVKGNQNINAYKFNEEKAISWLSNKVKKAAELLKKANVNVNCNRSMSAHFSKSTLDNDSEEMYLAYGFNIIGDYLSEDLKSKLGKHLNIFTSISTTKRKRNEIGEVNVKKSKGETSNPGARPPPSSSQKMNTPVLSAKEKARAKAASGSKSIFSFFNKKVVATD